MAHASQLEYVSLLSDIFKEHFENSRVLEIGSLDIHGSVRSFFRRCDYIGLDVADGKGVDVVCEGQKYDAPDDSFDVVISCEAMEHNPHWIGTFKNMIRLCRPGGLILMTCASTGRPEHGTARTDPVSSPLTTQLGWNYYKNLTDKDFQASIDLAPLVAAHRFWTNWNHYDLLFVGIKGKQLPSGEARERWESAIKKVDTWLSTESGGRVHRYRATMANLFGDWWFARMNELIQSLSWLHRPR
jgi:SAM-dependent methyltransferase